MRQKIIVDWHTVPIYFDIQYMALLTNLSESWIKRHAQQHKIPAHKNGKLWRFYKEEVRQWMSGEWKQPNQ